jgi:hypothetical protein
LEEAGRSSLLFLLFKEVEMKLIRIGAVMITVLVSLLGNHAYAAADNKAAEQAATSWLSLVDSEKYADAYTGFSVFFKDKMTQAKWEDQVKSARSIFGKLVERKLKSSEAVKTLPGAPDGDYVVVQYDTTFEKKKSAVETVTVLSEKGKWGVVGYYIK